MSPIPEEKANDSGWASSSALEVGTRNEADIKGTDDDIYGYQEVENNICKNFSCCGHILEDMHQLLQHYEDCHVIVGDDNTLNARKDSNSMRSPERRSKSSSFDVDNILLPQLSLEQLRNIFNLGARLSGSITNSTTVKTVKPHDVFINAGQRDFSNKKYQWSAFNTLPGSGTYKKRKSSRDFMRGSDGEYMGAKRQRVVFDNMGPESSDELGLTRRHVGAKTGRARLNLKTPIISPSETLIESIVNSPTEESILFGSFFENSPVAPVDFLEETGSHTAITSEAEDSITNDNDNDNDRLKEPSIQIQESATTIDYPFIPTCLYDDDILHNLVSSTDLFFSGATKKSHINGNNLYIKTNRGYSRLNSYKQSTSSTANPSPVNKPVSLLNANLLLDTDEKSDCELSSTETSSIIADISSSSDPKPYKCPVPGCARSYKNANGLKYHSIHGHKKIFADYNKPFKCLVPECFRAYKNLNGLKYHMVHNHSLSNSCPDDNVYATPKAEVASDGSLC
ncbi:Zinc finger protein sfp1 [Zancudomyces culisetae]|uniref:Zinc finger protein sfp1 n=1 Tax=Zancudomyces culisetae TaxID=1213189 RepID=A0A1R1PWB8_ZANCU|nr:Zinc finger protein sfp1 [Zancudomyces culisetae]|eukprot:OMH85203.1 Zinc finger protein sfp1 [Zancudomyces culisetae]